MFGALGARCRVENTYSEVLFCKCFVKRKTVFVFRFGMMNTQKKEPTSAAAATAAATVATESARCCTGNNSKLICVLAFACQFVRLIPGCIVAWDIDVEEQKVRPMSANYSYFGIWVSFFCFVFRAD